MDKIMLGVCGLLFVRNIYTFYCMNKSNNIIYTYCCDLIDQGRYDERINHYEEMKISYLEHLFKFWKLGKYSTIKDQYKEELRNYM